MQREVYKCKKYLDQNRSGIVLGLEQALSMQYSLYKYSASCRAADWPTKEMNMFCTCLEILKSEIKHNSKIWECQDLGILKK